MKRLLAGVLVLSVLIASAFFYLSMQTISVTQLNEGATRYDGHTVRVEGRVSQSAGILGVGGYIISDNQSSILVISNEGVPDIGRTVVVSGVFRKVVSINNLGYNTILADSVR